MKTNEPVGWDDEKEAQYLEGRENGGEVFPFGQAMGRDLSETTSFEHTQNEGKVGFTSHSVFASNSFMNALEELANMLDELASREVVTLADVSFLDAYNDKNDPLIGLAYEYVWHFFNDADIRSRDAGYDQWQRKKLRELAEKIRSREFMA